MNKKLYFCFIFVLFITRLTILFSITKQIFGFKIGKQGIRTTFMYQNCIPITPSLNIKSYIYTSRYTLSYDNKTNIYE